MDNCIWWHKLGNLATSRPNVELQRSYMFTPIGGIEKNKYKYTHWINKILYERQVTEHLLYTVLVYNPVNKTKLVTFGKPPTTLTSKFSEFSINLE